MGDRKRRTLKRCYNPYVPNEVWDLYKKDLRKLFKHAFPQQKFSITEYFSRSCDQDREYIKIRPVDDHPVDWPKVCEVVELTAREFGMKTLIPASDDPSSRNYSRFCLGNIRTWTIKQLDDFLANHSYEALEKKYDNPPPPAIVRTEQEKRLHQCCITGSYLEELTVSEDEVKCWLEAQIDHAIADGYDTFITGCIAGVEYWGGQIILEKRLTNPALQLIVTKLNNYNYINKMGLYNRHAYYELVRCADSVKGIGDYRQDNTMLERNAWMVDNSSRMIAYFNETQDIVEAAKKQNLQVIEH